MQNPNFDISPVPATSAEQARILDMVAFIISGHDSVRAGGGILDIQPASPALPLGQVEVYKAASFSDYDRSHPGGCWGVLVTENLSGDWRGSDTLAETASLMIGSGYLPAHISKIACLHGITANWEEGRMLLAEAGIFIANDFPALFCEDRFDPGMNGMAERYGASVLPADISTSERRLSPDVMDNIPEDIFLSWAAELARSSLTYNLPGRRLFSKPRAQDAMEMMEKLSFGHLAETVKTARRIPKPDAARASYYSPVLGYSFSFPADAPGYQLVASARRAPLAAYIWKTWLRRYGVVFAGEADDIPSFFSELAGKEGVEGLVGRACTEPFEDEPRAFRFFAQEVIRADGGLSSDMLESWQIPEPDGALNNGGTGEPDSSHTAGSPPYLNDPVPCKWSRILDGAILTCEHENTEKLGLPAGSTDFSVVYVNDGWNCRQYHSGRSSTAYYSFEDDCKVALMTCHPDYQRTDIALVPVATGAALGFDAVVAIFSPFADFSPDALASFSKALSDGGIAHICDATGAFPDVFQIEDLLEIDAFPIANSARKGRSLGLTKTVMELRLADAESVYPALAATIAEKFEKGIIENAWKELEDILQISTSAQMVPAIVEALSFDQLGLDSKWVPHLDGSERNRRANPDFRESAEIFGVLPPVPSLFADVEGVRELGVAADIAMIWQHVLSKEGLALARDLPLGAYKNKLQALGRALGIDYAVEARMGGTPLEFIIDGEK